MKKEITIVEFMLFSIKHFREFLVEREIFRGSRITPEAEDLLPLFVSIKSLAIKVHNNHAARVENDSRISKLIDDIIETMPKYIDNEQYRYNFPDFLNKNPRSALAISAAKAVLAAAYELKNVIYEPLPDDHLLHWHQYAPSLCSALKNVMQRSNPTMTLGLSNHGPIVRFFEEIIPLLSGEKPNRAAIARYLQRAAGGDAG